MQSTPRPPLPCRLSARLGRSNALCMLHASGACGGGVRGGGEAARRRQQDIGGGGQRDMPPAGDSPPPAALCPHTLPLCQAYEQLSRIGEGTYGVVMRCRHLASRELVAIKRFKETDSNEVSCRNGRVWGDAASFPAAPVWETGGWGGAVGLGGARQCPSNRPPPPPPWRTPSGPARAPIPPPMRCFQ